MESLAYESFVAVHNFFVVELDIVFGDENIEKRFNLFACQIPLKHGVDTVFQGFLCSWAIRLLFSEHLTNIGGPLFEAQREKRFGWLFCRHIALCRTR